MMKTIQIMLILLTAFLFSNCSDNDKITYKNQLSDLKQTSWKGTLVSEVSGVITDEGKTDILFITEGRGNSVVVKYGSAQKKDFEYVSDDKLLTISRFNPSSPSRHFLEGDWILIHEEKNRLVLEQELVNEQYLKMTLDIQRVY